MTDERNAQYSEIEDAQAGLRDCIEATKQLSERADDLLQQHRARLMLQSAQDGDQVSAGN